MPLSWSILTGDCCKASLAVLFLVYLQSTSVIIAIYAVDCQQLLVYKNLLVKLMTVTGTQEPLSSFQPLTTAIIVKVWTWELMADKS